MSMRLPGTTTAWRSFATLAALALTTAAALPSGALRAQAIPDSGAVAPAPAPPPDTALWIAVAERPRSTVVAVTLTYLAGSADDDVGKGGSAFLLAQVLEEMTAEALGPSFNVSVQAQRDRFIFTLLSAPGAWEAGLETLMTVANRRDLSDERFQRIRARLVNRMTFESGAPVREFELEAARVYGAGQADWARPLDGVLESLQSLTIQDLSQFRSRTLESGRALAAVVGPVDSDGAAALMAGVLGSAPDLAARSAGQAWTRGDRSILAREITNTAMTFAFPLPPDHSRTDAEFFAHVLGEKLVSDPPDPGVYSVNVAVLDVPAGPIAVVEAAVFPDRADHWARRIEQAVEEIRITNPDEDVFFPWQQRRFRSAALGADASPEALGRRMIEDLLRTGEIRDLRAETRDVTARKLVLLANALGAPRALIFGPDLGAQQDR